MYVLHRGEFQYKEVKIPSEQIMQNVGHLLPKNELLFIATDERNKSFFNALRPRFPVIRYLDDYMDIAGLRNINPNFLGKRSDPFDAIAMCLQVDLSSLIILSSASYRAYICTRDYCRHDRSSSVHQGEVFCRHMVFNLQRVHHAHARLPRVPRLHQLVWRQEPQVRPDEHDSPPIH
jgi:hypothetical protein